MEENNFSSEFLELSKFCYTTHLRGVPSGPKSYELQAVVVHIGSGSCGHYLTLRKVNECWYQVGMTMKLRTCFKLRVTAFYLKSVQRFSKRHCSLSTEMRFNLCTWLGEFSSCSCLTVLPGPARVLLNKICKD